jgi:hypothetical protein
MMDYENEIQEYHVELQHEPQVTHLLAVWKDGAVTYPRLAQLAVIFYQFQHLKHTSGILTKGRHDNACVSLSR